MNKGLIVFTGAAMFAIVASGSLAAQVYKVVDENGNVTYTDKPPADGTPAMILPEISVVETDYPAEFSTLQDPAGTAEPADNIGKTPRELRQMFSDFRLLSPAQDETFWGTANTVVVSWGANLPYEPGMSVTVMVDGQTHNAEVSSNLPLTLDRGEHQVYAVLRDQRGRRVVTSPIVTFNVKQATANVNRG
jgi:hypothetical protein